MHEMSLCQSVMETLQQAARDQGFDRVLNVHLAIGKLVAVEKPQFQLSFEILSKNTLAENASLEIEDIEGKGFCPGCRQQVPMDSLYCACPLCNNWGLEVVQGKELKISRLEVT